MRKIALIILLTVLCSVADAKPAVAINTVADACQTFWNGKQAALDANSNIEVNSIDTNNLLIGGEEVNIPDLGDYNGVMCRDVSGNWFPCEDVNFGGAFIDTDPNTDHATALYLDVNDGNNVRRLQVFIADMNTGGENRRVLTIPN